MLTGFSPSGPVTFESRAWEGRASGRHIMSRDGGLFLPKLENGDVVLADKEFKVDLLSPDNGLNMPPFMSSSSQSSAEEFFLELSR